MDRHRALGEPEARARCFARDLVPADVRQRMEEAILETLPPLELTVIDNRWVALR